MVDLNKKIRLENIKSNRFLAKACGIGAIGLALSASPLSKSEIKTVEDGRSGESAKSINFAATVGLLTAGTAAAAVFLETLNRGMRNNKNRQLLEQANQRGGR